MLFFYLNHAVSSDLTFCQIAACNNIILLDLSFVGNVFEKERNAAIGKSPSAETAKEAESNMQTIPDYQSLGTNCQYSPLDFHSFAFVDECVLGDCFASYFVEFRGFSYARFAFGSFCCFFWISVVPLYSIALTRKKRAFWVEPNICSHTSLELAFWVTCSSLIPTPAGCVATSEDEVKSSEGNTEEELKEIVKRKAFLESRKQFYGGEWAAAMKGIQDRTGVPSPQADSCFYFRCFYKCRFFGATEVGDQKKELENDAASTK
uniref:Uncharacterized protein n=1 Tax=Ditylenchus dipsaci TaxID=166011 RepID=A0A915DIK8_9BILA